MKTARHFLLLALVIIVPLQTAPAAADDQVPWREQYAYSVGMAAYPYTLPYLRMSQLRWLWTTQARDPDNIPHMPLNHFWHATHISNADYKDGGTPNNDVLYSVAWVHVGDEPIILSHPDMKDRYFVFQLVDFTSDNFGSVGQRVTGSAAGHFALADSSFEGELPEGVKMLPAATTPWVLIAGRTLVKDEADLSNVLEIQGQYRLTPLSYWGKPAQELPASHDIWPPYNPKKDPLATWRTINRAMTENPPPAYEAALLRFLSEVHIGPGQDLDSLDDDSKRGLARAARDAHRLAVRAKEDMPGGTVVNGWRRNPEEAGRLGKHGEYLARGVIQSLKGITANYAEEAKYFATYKDEQGDWLDAGKNSYTLTFPRGEEPPADAFWSLTMYGTDTNHVANPIDRYSLGDRSPGLKRNPDGSLTLFIQHESPGQDNESNWLPAPDGRFTVTLRIYRPQDSVLQGAWAPPAFVAIER